MALAILIFAGFLFLASTARSVVGVSASAASSGRASDFARAVGAQTAWLFWAVLISLSVVAPSFHASDLIKMLGIGSVAIGFAFQNILQNFLAGILLLLQEPFKLGDVISVTGLEGRVDDIQTRATIISTPDGHRAVIPNAVLFTNPVVVSDAYAQKASPQAPAQPHEAETANR